PQQAPASQAPAAAAAQPAASATGSQVKAPLPGTITSVNVKVGDVVKDGDTVVVLEAMKMQNNIETEFSGTVTSILVNQGDSVLEGAVLLTIA
ncbi:MAG TPA: biotin/lipoyl-binding protein, partial [Candidatus Prevotella intestinigallinarum]|nr:biotin/lipoyl-binding protein [Candidatus Prevotella intestinigallinarum]